MKSSVAIATLITGTLLLVSCGDNAIEDPVEYDAPIVRIGSWDRIESGGTGSIPFTIALDPDLTAEASWTLSYEGVISASIGGATSGTTGSVTVTVDITAGATTDDASVTLVVTNPPQDTMGGSSLATASFNVD